MVRKQCEKDSLGRLLYQTSLAVRNFAEKLLKPHDLTLEQFHLLKHMPVDQGLSQRQIGELIKKSPANLTRILDRLETKKLLVRRKNPTDRRASLVFMTEKGGELVSKIITVFEAFSDEMKAGVSPEEEVVFRLTLEKISCNIEAMSLKI